MLKVAVLGVFGGIVAAVYGLISDSSLAIVLAVGLVLASIEVVLLTKAAGGFSAVLAPVLAVNSVLLSSMFLWDGIRSESIVSVGLRVTEEYHIQAAVIGIVFSAAYSVGALLGGPRPVQITLAQIGESISEFRKAIKIPDGALVAAGYAGIILTIYGRQGSLVQGRYNVVDGPSWAVALSNAIAPVAVLVLCIVASKPGPWRWLAVVGIGIWFLLLFARASRTIAVFPILLIFARTFTSRASIRPYSVVLVAVATVFLMQLPLVGRANPDGVGIIPLTQQIFSRPQEIFSGFTLDGILGNILFSGPLTGVVANRQVPLESFWVSINPMPGSWAGWNEFKDVLRIDSSTPYNALGELGSLGWFVLATVACSVGIVISLATRTASRLEGAYSLAASLLVLGMTVFFSVSILQYNLRSSIRVVWYTLGALCIIWMASVAFRPRKVPSAGSQLIREDPDDRAESKVDQT